ncbi:hypothetical protein DOZ80_08700 [Pseudomonas fluorescens]|uniref:Integrase n=1 Tax=Pseudomonas fluorescens TaxID=294 RepID=A0A327NA01_PSEFL|nr:VPA1269 family protein [Pseudomonas fluorescens]RAI71902.1 hypothetical protein DOZ80_08700 [Pseudomonas fluorescens]
MGRKISFLSYSQASERVSKMGITSKADYLARYKECPGLPREPAHLYGEEYLGWDDYCGKGRGYYTFEEGRDAVIKMGIKSLSQYRVRCKEDSMLPSFPRKFYGGEYKGFYAFSGQENLKYASMIEASKAVVLLGCKNVVEYRVQCHQDPLLPSSPSSFYADEWKGWPFFLNMESILKTTVDKYATYDEFVSILSDLGIATSFEYNARYKEHPKLPSQPHVIYMKDWAGWREVFSANSGLYSTWQEAKVMVSQCRFTTKAEYLGGCSFDGRLPRHPDRKYKDFPGWVTFLLPEKYCCLDDVRCAVKIVGVKSSVSYKEVRKKYPLIPSHPERMFADEWVDWCELCDIPDFYSYESLQQLVRSHGCFIIKDYVRLISKLKDPKIPSSPEEVYPQWRSWYEFLEKPEPYTLVYIRGCGKGWVASVREFLKNQRSGQEKESNICRFIRGYIEPYDLGSSPQEFLTRKATDVRPFKELMSNQANRKAGRSLLLSVNSYLNEVLRNELTIEDDETGELVRVDGASNPFSTFEYKSDGSHGPSETTKPALAFQYVDAMKKWMISDTATTFSDLIVLHQFDADYFEVDGSLIDDTDPDCVFKKQGDKYLLWFPGYWMLAYTLISIPARARQVAYNDSGEFDEYIADIENDKIVWVKNKNPLAKCKSRQAFIQRCDDNAWGMHFTSNKTSYLGDGYDVPWAPETLVYWMIRFRKWQEKYNSIKRSKPWTECTRTNLNEGQLKRKGANCFLFRAFKEEQPPAYTARLSERLAAALYFTQPRNLSLATFVDGRSHGSLSHYESKYTPHCMRVSLITAYVMEFGLPIEVVMKLAGHASVVMSIYYVKVGAAFLRRRMDEGEKLALRDQAYAAQEMLEQNRLDELTHDLIANSELALQVLRAGNVGSTLVRDYGLCPYAAARCEDGGALVGGTNIWHPVPAGYLGIQNCVRCRHFITGPIFLGGLLSLWNEISLRLNFLSEHYFDFEKEIENWLEQIKVLDELEYDMEQIGGFFDPKERSRIELEIRKLQSEKEGVAKKMDMFLCDIQAITKQINECKALIAEQTSKDEAQVQLVVHDQNEIKIEIEQTSLFQQLNEVCINASIFQSASADFATPRRSQMIDRMALINKIRPAMCSLSEKEQLAVGNQVTKFLLQRLKTWGRVDQLIDGHILLEDLGDDERISKEELDELLTSKAPRLLDLIEVLV